jgi:hypothetical protein
MQIIGKADICSATSSGHVKHVGDVLECNIIRCYAETLSSSHRRAHIDVNMRLRSMATKLHFDSQNKKRRGLGKGKEGDPRELI